MFVCVLDSPEIMLTGKVRGSCLSIGSLPKTVAAASDVGRPQPRYLFIWASEKSKSRCYSQRSYRITNGMQSFEHIRNFSYSRFCRYDAHCI